MSTDNTGCLPDFFVIGAAKSGTSSLYRYLIKHPRIFMPSLKEPEFFSREEVFAKGEDWYRGLFREARPDQICGEASTTYSRWPHTLDSAKLISKFVPHAKFIYLMRHPVDRAYSHYGHDMRKAVTMTFEEALERDSIYVDCSMYIRQIERYLRFFPRDRFLFVFQSQLAAQPHLLLADIQKFLGINEIDLVQGGAIRINVAGPDYYIRLKTTMRLRSIPPFGLLARVMPKKLRDFLYAVLIKHSLIGRKLKKESQILPLHPETRSGLFDVFAEPNRELEEFLGVDLSEWGDPHRCSERPLLSETAQIPVPVHSS